MSKQEIIKVIAEKFAPMGISYKTETNTDITITAEFLDAGWSTGEKKINYESSIFADEASQTIFMWELTKEIGSGFSFGGDSESSFQSGTTLFRKVKSVQYGPDGKAFEINLDLGAIPKAVKETAKQYGWKFKTVLKREKALWPVDYIQAQGEGEQTANNEVIQQNSPDGILFCSNCGNRLSAAAVFCPECGVQRRGTVKQQILDNSKEQVREQPIKADKTSIFFWILFTLFVVLDLTVGKLLGGIFVLLSIVILIVLFKNRKSISKGFFKTIFWFIIAIIIIVVMYAVSIFLTTILGRI